MDAKGMALDRRRFVRSGGSRLAAGAAPMRSAPASRRSGPRDRSPGLLDDSLALPGTKAAQVDVGDGAKAWRVAHAADAGLFCGSGFKTFVLATYLREMEAGRLSLDEQLTIDDKVRSTGGAVFEHLTGTTQARIVLEAMIAHSDNTATDVAMGRVGADKVRAFIAEAGLKDVRIPDNTRRFFSYLAGYPQGTDMGIEGLRAMAADKPGPGPMRQALNDVDTMACPAATFVGYYKRALAGADRGGPRRVHRVFGAFPASTRRLRRASSPSSCPTTARPSSAITWPRHRTPSAGSAVAAEGPVHFDVDHAPESLRSVDGMVLPHGFLSYVPSVDLYSTTGPGRVTRQRRDRSTVTLEELARVPWVMTHHEPTAFTPAARQLNMIGVEPDIQVVVESFLPVPFLVAGTPRVALLQRQLANRLGRRGGCAPLGVPVGRGPLVEAFWSHPSHRPDPAHAWLRETLLEAGSMVRDAGS